MCERERASERAKEREGVSEGRSHVARYLGGFLEGITFMEQAQVMTLWMVNFQKELCACGVSPEKIVLQSH